MEFLTLNNGIHLPQLGLGTYGVPIPEMETTIREAYASGYRLFDTSPNYNNDRAIGESIKNLGLNRNEFMLVEKVDSLEQKNNVRKAFERCLRRLEVDYLDFYLIHWPYPKYFVRTWKIMERLVEEGLVKTVGVCNFRRHHMETLLAKANLVPAINQIELHPLFTQKEDVDFCISKGIKIMSYTPLARMAPELIASPLLQELGNKYGKTVPQIILRWNIEKGYSVIPKSGNADRLAENINIFDFGLSRCEIESIDALNQDRRFRFDPDDMSRYPKSRLRKAVRKVKRLLYGSLSGGK